MVGVEPPPPSFGDSPPEKPPETQSPAEPLASHKAHFDDTTNPPAPGPMPKPADRHTKTMENFKALFLKFAEASSPTKSIPPMQRALMEQRLHQFFPQFHTPDHPPYAALIETAIKKLNEEGGSSEETISQFIRKEYPDLPWAHDVLLKHHLENLCKNGDIFKACTGFYMLDDDVTDVVRNHNSSCSPSSCTGADSSSRFCTSSCSGSSFSASCSRSPGLKRKSRKKQQPCGTIRENKGRKRGMQPKRTNRGKVYYLRSARVLRRRQGRQCKKDVLEDGIEINSETLMVKERMDETEEQNQVEEDCDEVAEGINRVRGKRRKIKKQGQRLEPKVIIYIDVDEPEDVVNGERSKQHEQGKLIDRYNNQAEGMEIQNEAREYPEEVKEEQSHSLQLQIQDISELQLQQEEEVQEEEQQDDLKEAQLEVTAWQDTIKQGSWVTKEESLLKETNFKVIGEQSLLEEHIPESELGNKKKKMGWSRKTRKKGGEVCLKHKHVPGRGRGRPRKKDLVVEETPSNTGQMEGIEIQDPVSEVNTEVSEDKYQIVEEWNQVLEEQNQLMGNISQNFELSQGAETKMVKEIKKAAQAVEETKLQKQINSIITGEPQKDVIRCAELKEVETLVGEDQYQSGKQKNEVIDEENYPQKQHNVNQQSEKHNGSVMEQEVEAAEIYYQNPQIQEKIQPGGQYEKMTKRLTLVDDAERNIDKKVTVFPKGSSHSAIKEPKKNSNEVKKQQREIPGADEILEITGVPEEHQLDSSTSEKSSDLKSVERSSQPQCLRKLQQAEEQTLCRQLRPRTLKAFSSCGML